MPRAWNDSARSDTSRTDTSRSRTHTPGAGPGDGLRIGDIVLRNRVVTSSSLLGYGVANSPLETLEQYVANLGKYYAIGIEIGTKDTLIGSNQQLHTAMTKLRIPHYYEEYDGDHTNKVRERIEQSVLPFFARNLVAPANPTNPQIQP